MALFGGQAAQWRERYEADRRLRAAWVGDIAGIKFDFRRPELPAAQWECPSVLDGQAWSHAGWLFATRIEGAQARQGDHLNRVVLYPGDSVEAEAVERVSAATDPLQPAADQEVSRLHVVIRSSDGQRRAGLMCQVYRKGAVLPHRQHLGVLAAFEDRLPQLPEHESSTAEAKLLASRVAKGLVAAEQEIQRRRELAPGTLDPMQYGTVEIELRQIVNLAALYGYRLGRAEAAHHMEDLARTGDASIKNANAAGIKGGDANRDPGRELFAQDFWARYPTDTIHAAIEEWRRTRPQDAESSLRRSFELYCPDTSRSYATAQASIARRKARRKQQAHRRLVSNTPPVGD